MYSFMVTLSFRPESLSPTLNRKSPNRSNNLYRDKKLDKNCEFLNKKIYTLIEGRRLTYLELPFLVSGPGFWDTCDDARPIASLVTFNELLNCQVIDVDSFDSVCEGLRVMNF